jgi:hypothetical protein
MSLNSGFVISIFPMIQICANSGKYSQETADILARQLLANCTSETTIAVVSAPSVFVQLKNIIVSSVMPTSSCAQQQSLLYILFYALSN